MSGPERSGGLRIIAVRDIGPPNPPRSEPR